MWRGAAVMSQAGCRTVEPERRVRPGDASESARCWRPRSVAAVATGWSAVPVPSRRTRRRASSTPIPQSCGRAPRSTLRSRPRTRPSAKLEATTQQRDQVQARRRGPANRRSPSSTSNAPRSRSSATRCSTISASARGGLVRDGRRRGRRAPTSSPAASSTARAASSSATPRRASDRESARASSRDARNKLADIQTTLRKEQDSLEQQQAQLESLIGQAPGSNRLRSTSASPTPTPRSIGPAPSARCTPRATRSWARPPSPPTR